MLHTDTQKCHHLISTKIIIKRTNKRKHATIINNIQHSDIKDKHVSTININCNNTSENYIWVKNNGSSTATITLGDVSLNETEYDTDDIHVFTTANNISITSGQIMELKIIATTEAAFINVAFTYA